MSYTPAQIAQLALQAGFSPGRAGMAVAIALAESGGNPAAIGDVALQTAKWGPSVGLWQIRSLNADRGTGRTRDEIANRDPATNAKHAYVISSGGASWGAWSTYTNGAYKAHIDAAGAAVKAAGGDLPDVTNPADVNVGQVADALLPLDGITDPLVNLGRLMAKLLDPDWWRRIGVGALGVVLVLGAALLLARELIPKVGIS